MSNKAPDTIKNVNNDHESLFDLIPSSFTDKQRLYIAYYLTSAKYNALKAARLAGYKNPVSTSQDHAQDDHKVKIWITSYLKSSMPTADELVQELASIALVDLDHDSVSPAEKRKALMDLLDLQGKLIKRVKIDLSPAEAMDALFGSDPPDDDSGD